MVTPRTKSTERTQDASLESEPEYEARCILDQRVVGTKRKTLQYLIDWVGEDSDGQPYEPTWEPEENASEVLAKNWRARIRQDPTLVGRYTQTKREEELRKKRRSDGKRKADGGISDDDQMPTKKVKFTAQRPAIERSARDRGESASQSPIPGHAVSHAQRKTSINLTPPSKSTRTKLRKGSSARPKGVAEASSGRRESTQPSESSQRGESPEMQFALRKKRIDLVASSSPTIEHEQAQAEPAIQESAAPAVASAEENAIRDLQQDGRSSEDYLADFSESQAAALHQVADLLMDDDTEPESITDVINRAEATFEAITNAPVTEPAEEIVHRPEQPAANTSIVADSQAGSQLQSVVNSSAERVMAVANMDEDVQVTITEVQRNVAQAIPAFVDPAEVSMLSIVNSTPQDGSSGDRSGRMEEDLDVASQRPAGTADGSISGTLQSSASLNELNAALAERDEKIAALESKVDHLQRSAKTNQEDLEFHKTMYTNASNQAYSLANDLNEARAEIKLLKQQLDLGLKQKELFYASASETKDKTIDELQKQLRLLLDQNRATNDEIRARARDYPNVIATNNRLRRELDAKDEEINDYSVMLKKAKKRIETLYGPRMGRLPRLALVEDVNDEESESSTDEDFNPGSSNEDEDDDETEDEDAEQELVRNVAPPLASPVQPVDARVPDVSMVENVAQPVADLGVLESAMPAQQLSHGDHPGWLICQWCEERNVPCGFAVHGYEEMELHAMSHVRPM